MMTLAEVNALSPGGFQSAFGDVAEHSPWLAQQVQRPFASREAMIAAFVNALASASPDQKRALIRAHPDLATKARLTDHSSREQSGAGLASLSREEFEKFTLLNESYKTKFGFPFVYAVKGATRRQILASFAERLNNDADTEFAMALTQIARIFRFRIEDRVAP